MGAIHQHRLSIETSEPDNILVTQDGQIKIMDFGIAKTLGNHGEFSSGRLLVGTYRYLAQNRHWVYALILEQTSIALASYSMRLSRDGILIFPKQTLVMPFTTEDTRPRTYEIQRNCSQRSCQSYHAINEQKANKTTGFCNRDGIFITFSSKRKYRC